MDDKFNTPTEENTFADGEETISDSLSKEEITMLKKECRERKDRQKQAPPHDTSDKATFFRYIKQNKLLAGIALFVAVALVVGAIGGSVYTIFGIFSGDIVLGKGILTSYIFNDLWAYTYDIDDEKPYEQKYRNSVINGILYVDMVKIAKSADWIISGGNGVMQFTSKNNSSVSFEHESDTVYINKGRTYMLADTVDGKQTDIEACAYIDDDSCLVPYSFLKRAVDGETMIVKFNQSKRTVYIKPMYVRDKDDPDTLIMEHTRFITDNFGEVTMPIAPRPVYHHIYTIDITPYIESINSEDLTLANKTSPLSSSFVPNELTKLTCNTAPNRTFQLEKEAADALHAMMIAMEKEGITDTYVTSAYRSYQYQENLYEGYVRGHMEEGMSREEAEAMASTYSARPGESEHQTGLCLDFTTEALGGRLNENFEKTQAFTWLSNNAHKYGFILRYPREKVSLTGYDYEPWHYRFVGMQAASEMHDSGECFEEYLGLVEA